jgi:hypothetical protein
LILGTNAVGLLSKLAPSPSVTPQELRLKLPPSLDLLGESSIFSFRDVIAAATLVAMKEGSTNIGRKIAENLDSGSEAGRS